MRYWLGYGVLIAVVWLGMVYLPRLQRVSAPAGYYDIHGMKEYESGYFLEPIASLALLKRNDGICYRLGREEKKRTCFGWVAGLPGDAISIVGGRIHVNGQPAHTHDPVNLPDIMPVTVPASRIYVVSSAHALDSVQHGFLPLAAVRGRVGDLP